MSEDRSPNTLVGAAGQTASEVVQGLGQQPVLLGLIVLNIIFIATGGWFLHELRAGAGQRMDMLIERCLPKSVSSTEIPLPIPKPPEIASAPLPPVPTE